MSVLKILMAVSTTAQILLEVTNVHVALATVWRAMATSVQVCTDTKGSNLASIILLYLMTDIDECSENIDDCGQLCRNTQGSYSCSCRTGYRLALDGAACHGNDQNIIDSL